MIHDQEYSFNAIILLEYLFDLKKKSSFFILRLINDIFIFIIQFTSTIGLPYQFVLAKL